MTYAMVRRLKAAGLVAQALAVLDARQVARIKFQTTQWVWSDDPEALWTLAVIGVHAEKIIAIDPYWPPSA